MMETIGPYRVVRELSARAALVLHAVDPHTHGAVAIKLLTAERLARPDADLNFEREYRALMRVQSEHVVMSYGAGTHANLPYFAMELISGPSLRRFIDPTPLIDENAPPPSAHGADAIAVLADHARMARVGHAMAQLCGALATCHERDVIHGDVHPDNALVAHGDVVKLIDFGVSRGRAGAIRTNDRGMVVGTFKYLAPEAALGSDTIDARLDLYLLGITLYELLAGRHPFYSENSVGYAYHHARKAPPPLATLNPNVAVGLAALTHALLEKDPRNRPASAHEVARVLGPQFPPHTPAHGRALPGALDVILDDIDPIAPG